VLVLLDLLHLFWRHKRVRDILLLQVEVLKVNLPALYIWFDRWGNLLSFQIGNVEVTEPGVLQNFMDIILGA
jgi:hypothetical protein